MFILIRIHGTCGADHYEINIAVSNSEDNLETEELKDRLRIDCERKNYREREAVINLFHDEWGNDGSDYKSFVKKFKKEKSLDDDFLYNSFPDVPFGDDFSYHISEIKEV